MSEFASCYFCGTALDAQIDPYPVVPEDAATDDRPTVDLCPVCRRKLSKVLDVALSAAEGAETTATPLAAGPDPSPLSADHEDPTADMESDEDEGDAAYAVEPTGEATAVEDADEEDDETDGSGTAAETDGEFDGDDEGGGDGEDHGDEEDRVDGEVAPGSAGEDGHPATDAGDPVTDGESAATTAGDEAASVEGAVEADDAVANGESPETAADDGAGAGESEEAEASDTDQGGSDGPSILSTPAAQKVVKLLQNREFPVEREEIEVVASNAYAIPQHDCADVIDALVSEGYVDERKGELVRPEE